jgi:hypothetical protein
MNSGSTVSPKKEARDREPLSLACQEAVKLVSYLEIRNCPNAWKWTNRVTWSAPSGHLLSHHSHSRSEQKRTKVSTPRLRKESWKNGSVKLDSSNTFRCLSSGELIGLTEAPLNFDLRSHIPDSRHIARRVRTSRIYQKSPPP